MQTASIDTRLPHLDIMVYGPDGWSVDFGMMERNKTYTMKINGKWVNQGKPRFLRRYLVNNEM